MEFRALKDRISRRPVYYGASEMGHSRRLHAHGFRAGGVEVEAGLNRAGVEQVGIMKLEVRMDVREAVEKARRCVAEFFAGEDISHVGVEEVVFDGENSVWKVTIGFFRSWNRLDGLPASMYCAWDERSYKVVLIDDPTGNVGSMIHCTFTNMGIKPD